MREWAQFIAAVPGGGFAVRRWSHLARHKTFVFDEYYSRSYRTVLFLADELVFVILIPLRLFRNNFNARHQFPQPFFSPRFST